MTLPGWVLSLAALGPNVILFVVPATKVPAPLPAGSAPRLRYILPVERLGQAGAFLIALVATAEVNSPAQWAAVAVMALSLLLYYGTIERYLVRARAYASLFEPLLGIPLPMVVAPTVYFLALSALLPSWPLAACALMFGIGHAYTGRLGLQRIARESAAAAD